MASNSTTSLAPPPSPMDSVIQISIPVSTKLDRQNFLTWKSQIEPIINGFGLSRFLSPDISPPAKDITVDGVSRSNPAYLPWYMQDRFLLGWLRSSVSEGVLSQYVACQSARELWVSLHQLYSAVSTARVMDLRRALQTTTRGSQSCGSFFERMRSIADQLASAGEPVPDSELVRSILSGLGLEYNSFVWRSPLVLLQFL